MKKILTAVALVCTLLMVFSVIASADIHVDANKGGVANGEQVVITVTSDAEIKELTSIQYNLSYDATKFEFVGMESEVFDQANPNAGVFPLVMFKMGETFDVPSGIIAKVTFKAIVDTADATDFTLTLEAISDKNYNDVTSDPAYAGLEVGTGSVEVLIHNHVYNIPSYDSDYHYDECSCGAKSNMVLHVYDNACDKTCACGNVRTTVDHVYDNACDVDCNVCLEVRDDPADHVYDNACDVDCNVCLEVRDDPADHVYTNGCDDECNVCGDEREPEPHVYDNACDNMCNVCGETRTVGAHVYDGECDGSCNICGVTRTPKPHTYSGDCDTICNGCGLIRVATAEHTYVGACDADCDVCGEAREAAEHTYDNDCDVDCNVCGTVRVPADHVYDNNCDADCNVCGTTRTPGDHVYVSDCDTDCNSCGEVREVPHLYDNACDTECNLCGTVRTVDAHVYDNACDADCNVCGTTRTPAAHVYDNACDADCNVCGVSREVAHSYTVLKNDATQHWYECSVCGEVKADSKEAHKGGSANCAAKAKCSVCNVEYGAVDSNNHAYATTLTQGTDTHYYACSRCSVKKDEAKHSYTGYTASNGSHTGKCVCGKTVTESCSGGTATCVDKAVCTTCNTAYGEVNAANHKSTDVKYVAGTDGKHTKKSACCNAVLADDEACSGGSATCEDKAVCEKCGAAYGELAAHTGGSATCSDKAVCTVCGEGYGEVDANAHDFGGALLTDEEGHWHKCSKCDDTDEKVAHEYTDGKCACGVEAPADNTVLIIVLVIVGVLVLAGAGFAVWFFVFKKKK